MPGKHISTQFDSELAAASTRVLEMGGLAEAQVRLAVLALAQQSSQHAEQVLKDEVKLNALEVQIDRELSAIIARRQPTAGDLRLLIAISKTIGNLERIGDEAARIARMVRRLMASGTGLPQRLPSAGLALEADLATRLLRKALDAFARLDVEAAVQVLQEDPQIDREFESLLRQLITYMMEDPRTISACIDLVFVAKAIERVGDHAKNLAEQIIYVVKGADVRHSSVQAVQALMG